MAQESGGLAQEILSKFIRSRRIKEGGKCFGTESRSAVISLSYYIEHSEEEM